MDDEETPVPLNGHEILMMLRYSRYQRLKLVRDAEKHPFVPAPGKRNMTTMKIASLERIEAKLKRAQRRLDEKPA